MFDWNLDIQQIFSVFMVLFAIIDPIGIIPIVIQVRQNTGQIDAGKASAVALMLMIFFLFAGEFILQLLGVSVQDFAIAGSLVIFFIALEMLLGITLYRDQMPASASLVPLAFPLIAGTGTMTTILSLRAEYTALTIIIAIVLNVILVYLVMRYVERIEKLLGPVGTNVVRKVFGVILLSISIKLFRANAGI